MPYGDRSRFERTVRSRLGNKVNMNMHGDPNGYDALSPIGEQVGIITPSAVHFISSHGNAPPDIDPARHRLMIHGMVDRPLVFTMAELKRLPSVSRIYYIECLANRPAPGERRTVTDNHGMLSCSEWTGVPVSVLLKEANVKAGGNWIIGESDEGTRSSRSAPLAKMMLDALVAYGQNGEPIRPQQGYPLRLVIPGFEGKYHVKWLKGIKVVDRPYITYWEHGTFMSNANTKGQYFMEQGPKSVITFPGGGQKLTSRGFYTIAGFAWSGSGAVTAGLKFLPMAVERGTTRSSRNRCSHLRWRAFNFRGRGTVAKRCCNRGVPMKRGRFNRRRPSMPNSGLRWARLTET